MIGDYDFGDEQYSDLYSAEYQQWDNARQAEADAAAAHAWSESQDDHFFGDADRPELAPAPVAEVPPEIPDADRAFLEHFAERLETRAIALERLDRPEMGRAFRTIAASIRERLAPAFRAQGRAA